MFVCFSTDQDVKNVDVDGNDDGDEDDDNDDDDDNVNDSKDFATDTTLWLLLFAF